MEQGYTLDDEPNISRAEEFIRVNPRLFTSLLKDDRQTVTFDRLSDASLITMVLDKIDRHTRHGDIVVELRNLVRVLITVLCNKGISLKQKDLSRIVSMEILTPDLPEVDSSGRASGSGINRSSIEQLPIPTIVVAKPEPVLANGPSNMPRSGTTVIPATRLTTAERIDFLSVMPDTVSYSESNFNRQSSGPISAHQLSVSSAESRPNSSPASPNSKGNSEKGCLCNML